MVQVVQAQNDRDENVRVLVEAMARSCEFAQDAKGLKGSPRHAVIIEKILEQVVECAYFIRDYTRDASFGRSTCCVSSGRVLCLTEILRS